GPDETAGALYARLAELGAAVVRQDLPRLVAGELQATPQDEALATHAPMLSRDDGRIDWTAPARRVHDRVRGMTPWPGASASLAGKRIKILETRLGEATSAAPTGTIVAIDDSAVVACGDG